MDFADYNVYPRKSVVLFRRLCLINKLDFLHQIDASIAVLPPIYSIIISKRVKENPYKSHESKYWHRQF